MKKLLLVCLVLAVAFFGIQFYASGVAEEKVADALEKSGGKDMVKYEKVSFDLIRQDVKISNILVSPPNSGEKEKMKIDEIVIHEFDDKAESDFPGFMSVSAKGIDVKNKEFGELGYADGLMVNVDVDYTYDKEKKELNIKKIGMGADNAGEIDISFHLSNIDINPNQMIGILFTYPQIVLHNAKIVYNDDSFAERIIELSAKQQNMEVKDFKEGVAMSIDQEIERAGDDFTKSTLKKVKKFINDPGDFSISVSPSKPCPLGSLMRAGDPNAIIGILNLKIET